MNRNGNLQLTHAVTHEQKNWDGNSGTESTCGCGNPAANPLNTTETVRKAALSNFHTQEVTGSSPAVSTKTLEIVMISRVFLVFGKRKDLLPSHQKRRGAGGLVMTKKSEAIVKGAHFHASS